MGEFEARFSRERTENRELPECGPYLRFKAPQIFRVQSIAAPAARVAIHVRRPGMVPKSGMRTKPQRRSWLVRLGRVYELA